MVYDPDCRTDSRVYVNGHRLPASTVNLYIRKEGPMDVTRYVEGTFASPFRGEDFLQYFETQEKDTQSSWDTLKVDVLDSATDEYNTEFHGLVTGVGSSPGPEREWSYRAQGPGLFLNKISASKNFTTSSTSVVLDYIESQLESKFPIPVTVGSDDPTLYYDSNIGIDIIEGILHKIPLLGQYEVPGGSKGFQSNKHTLKDVINWLRDRVKMRLWFEPTEEGVSLIGLQEPTVHTHNAHYIDNGNLRVVNNDALTELRPINTLTLKSKVTDSLGPKGIFEIKEIKTGSKYNTVKVREPTLFKRAGNTEYIAAPDTLSDAKTMEGLRNDAASMLKQKIDQTTGGDMQTLLRSPIKPFDTVIAKPTCDHSVATSTDPVTYEVSRVHHKITPSGISETKLNVGLHTPLDEIEVVNEDTEDV